MTRFIHDQFAKDYLRDLLSSLGTVETSYRVASEVREIDVLFSPSKSAISSINSFGLLGEIVKTNCILEPFRNPPNLWKIRTCINKLFDVYAYLDREARKNNRKIREEDLPYLWLLVPTTSNQILDKFRKSSDDKNQINGVYSFVEGLNTGIVVIHRLPEIPETLCLRILGKGQVQTRAINELNALPSNNPIREKALLWLSNLQANLENIKKLDKQDEDLVMAISPIFKQRLQEAEEKGKQEGKQEGWQEGILSLVMRLLSKRFGTLSPELNVSIGQLSLNHLESLSEALLDFSSIEDLESWLRANS
jgi:Domain of unknown function (DUF4351)